MLILSRSSPCRNAEASVSLRHGKGTGNSEKEKRATHFLPENHVVGRQKIVQKRASLSLGCAAL